MPPPSSFRTIAAKLNNYELRKLIFIAVTDVSVAIVDDNSSSPELKALAKKFIGNPEIFAERIYPIILKDERVDNDVPDSVLRIITKESFDYFL